MVCVELPLLMQTIVSTGTQLMLPAIFPEIIQDLV